LIDFQGFIGENREMVVKEMVILKTSSGGRDVRYRHYEFCPPYNFKRLKKEERRQACWLNFNHHGLEWESGNVAYDRLPSIVRNLGGMIGSEDEEQVYNVYVKGLEKTKFIRSLIQSNELQFWNLVELGTAGCPNFKTLYKGGKTTSIVPCPSHRGHHKGVCSLKNVFALYKWMS
jgi:hypothetical protein